MREKSKSLRISVIQPRVLQHFVALAVAFATMLTLTPDAEAMDIDIWSKHDPLQNVCHANARDPWLCETGRTCKSAGFQKGACVGPTDNMWSLVARKASNGFRLWDASCKTCGAGLSDCSSTVCNTQWKRMAFVFADTHDYIVWFDKRDVHAGCLATFRGEPGETSGTITMSKRVAGVTTTANVGVYCDFALGIAENFGQSDSWLGVWSVVDPSPTYISNPIADEAGRKCLGGHCRSAPILVYVSVELADVATLPFDARFAHVAPSDTAIPTGTWFISSQGVQTTGQAVDVWQDMGDGGVNLVPTSTSVPDRRPLLVPGVTSTNHAAVRFDGVDDFLTSVGTGKTIPSYNTHARTVTIVFRQNGNPFPGCCRGIFGMVNEVSNTQDYLSTTDVVMYTVGDLPSAGDKTMRIVSQCGAVDSGSAPYNDQTFQVYTMRFDGSFSTLWVDGISVGTPAACGTGTFGPDLLIGGRHHAALGDENAEIDVLEFQHHTSALSDAKIVALHTHLRTLYGI